MGLSSQHLLEPRLWHLTWGKKTLFTPPQEKSIQHPLICLQFAWTTEKPKLKLLRRCSLGGVCSLYFWIWYVNGESELQAFKKLYFLMILSVDQEALDLYPKYDSVHHVHAVSAEVRRVRRRHRSLGTGGTSCERPCGCWELNPSRL